jgi:hypothetical protein
VRFSRFFFYLHIKFIIISYSMQFTSTSNERENQVVSMIQVNELNSLPLQAEVSVEVKANKSLFL